MAIASAIAGQTGGDVAVLSAKTDYASSQRASGYQIRARVGDTRITWG